MDGYMICIELPEKPDDEFFRIIPHQRAYINRMMRKGIISLYSLSYDRTRLWVIVHANSLMEVKHIMGSFPMFNYMKFKINSLLFHETSDAVAPQFWLN